MIFMVNQYLMELNSGVEYAEINRQRLLKHYKIPSKIVTRDYNSALHRNMEILNLEDRDVVNLYDYFQETESIPSKFLRSNDLNWSYEYAVEQGANYSRVTEGDHVVADINFAAGTFGRVDHVDYYDAYNHIVKKDWFDWRGFKSAEEYLTPVGETLAKFYLKLDGSHAIEEYYMQTGDGQTVVSLLKLIDYHGEDYNFDNRDELFTFFLDEINQEAGLASIVIADRPVETNSPVLNMQTSVHKFISIPILHGLDRANQDRGQLDSVYYEALVQRSNELDGVIVMTEAQKKDLNKILNHPSFPIFVIPGNSISSKQQKLDLIPMSDRKSNKAIFVGRLGAEKQVDLLIRAFGLVHNDVPNASLDIYGYGDTTVVNQLNELISELGLVQQIKVKGFEHNLDDIYNQAQLFISANHGDAMPMAMIDALGHGLPVVTFSDNYGPSEIIDSHHNGILLNDGDVLGMAESIVHLFTNAQDLQEYSNDAYKIYKKYGDRVVIKQWKNLIETEKGAR